MINALFAVALHLSPCTVADGKARCGTFDVPEAAESNRTLHLKLIVLPATARNESAIFPMAGGPGDTVTDGAPFMVKQFAAERRLHDIVLLDLRGTERSALCPDAVKVHTRLAVADDLFPAALIADCRKEVEAKADPRHFTLNEFADDIEAARIALDYGPINIIGLSYGTRAALTFEARHPKSVRSILMYGPLPADNLTPLNFAADAQSVMDRMVPRAEVEKALGKLPVKIVSGPYTINMTRGMFAEYLRTKLFTANKREHIRPALRRDRVAIADENQNRYRLVRNLKPRQNAGRPREAPKTRTVVFANFGHADLNPCAQKLETEFFDAGAFEKLDDSCASKP